MHHLPSPMRFWTFAMLLISSIWLLSACDQSNDTWTDAYQMEFVDILTDSRGLPAYAVTDQGDTLRIQNQFEKAAKADTVFRYVAVIVRQGDACRISSASKAFSPQPHKKNKDFATDPVHLQSIWRGSNYINGIIQMPGKELVHTMGFIDEGITTNAQGIRILHLRLLHDNEGDVAAFSRTAYISCPLHQYADTLIHRTDSIYFSVNESGVGNVTHALLY